MQPLALETNTDVLAYDSQPLGNIAAQSDVPYLDVTATRDQDSIHLTLSLINRHPTRPITAKVALSRIQSPRSNRAWLLTGIDPLAVNSPEHPTNVQTVEIDPPILSGDFFTQKIPPTSVTVITLTNN